MDFSDFSVKHLFSTPFVMASFPSEVKTRIHADLTPVILKKAQETKGAFISNVGGWQSDDKLPDWGGEPVQIILAALTKLINQVTLYREGASFRRAPIDWKVNGWANINRREHFNIVHTHPGAYWSAVYYVSVDEGEETIGGELELTDPRGVLPIMYCPSLRFGIQGYTSAGTSELHKPKSGECVLFPSWLPHAVRPFRGEGTRISLAFNFSVQT